jgi:uncharacterized protein (TIGR03437 family)
MRRLVVSWAIACGILCLCEPALAQVSSLGLSSATSNPGGTIALSLSFSASVTSPAGLEWTLAYPSSQISAISVLAGPVATAAGKTMYCASATGSVTCLLAGPTNGNTMASGVAATVQLTLALTAGTTAITIINPVGVDAIGNGLTVSAVTNAIVIVPTVSVLTCSPANLNSGAAASCTVTLNAAAPTGGSSVTLASNNTLLTVPASVTVAAGTTTATFSATAAASIANNQSATVTATLGNSSQTATIGLPAPGLLSDVTCSPTSLGQSAVSTCTVTMTHTAPAGGSSVTLASNNGSLAVPTSMTVAAGATTATFNATAAASIAGNQSATVTATLGTSFQTATISLLGPVIVSGVGCNSAGVMSGVSTTCSITLSQAVSAATTVALNSSSALLLIPATVTISAGNATASVTAIAGTVLSNTQAVVSATLGASSQKATVLLWSTPTLSSLTCTPAKLAVGGSSSCIVALSNAAGTLAIGISSSNAALVAPASVTVQQGISSASFTVTAQAAYAQSIVLTASYNGASTSQSLVVTAATQLHSILCEPRGSHTTCWVVFNAPSDTGTADVSLASSNQSIKLPATLTIKPGQSSVRFRIDAISPSNGDATTITAQLGADVVQEKVSLDSQPGPRGVPGYLYAKYGTRIQFRVSASDPFATLTASDLPAGAVFDAASGAFQWVPGVASQGTHHVVFTEVGAGGSIAAGSILEVDSGTPVVTRVVNAANRSEGAACSPGAIASLEGRWLGEGPAASDATGHSTELSGIVVKVNGIEVPILSVSASRVDFLCPAAAPGSKLEIALQNLAGVAQPIQTTSREATPGIFSLDGSGGGQGMIMHSGTTTMVMIPNYQYPSRAALPGEPVTLYATGIGAAQDVSVVAGGVEVTPQSIVPLRDFAGMYQISVQLPSGRADGDMSISLKMKMLDGAVVTSNEVWVATEILSPQ